MKYQLDLYSWSEKLTKKYMWWRIRFSAIVHLQKASITANSEQKASITANSENVAESQSTAYRRKYYHLF